ncbi:hypothetical protein B0T25DRAFT_237648 [Lasiosphaeria hispida]|uniref:Hemerythrin-like domain-containing protein n=1 Tax=Lasiosphaeria hispida TaxID=260671 RepID=A0AAJ0HE87_9PEZI|nr:hypothetical protein B0T25DRAFT_237648 [Lasiosphaeria hispida]
MARSFSRRWPERPFSLITTTSHHVYAPALPSNHHAVRVARLMALTHNTIFRAFNAIYAQAGVVDPSKTKDVADFMTFATFAIAFLDNHHQCEENIFFPMLEAQSGTPGLMTHNVEQHRAFDVPLHALRRYVDEVKSGAARLDAAALRARIQDLAVPLEQHLHDEIPSLLELSGKLSEEAINTCYKALHDEAEGTTDPFRIGPLVLGCQDSTHLMDGEMIQFPELPFRLVPYLVDHIVSRRYAGAWRFCPGTFHGQPRETAFFEFGKSEASTRRKSSTSRDEILMQAALDSGITRAKRRFLVDRLATPVFVLMLLFSLYLAVAQYAANLHLPTRGKARAWVNPKLL